jgi:hypothetical protein
VVLAAACERSCAVCFALFLLLYAAAAPVYSLLYGLVRSPQLHHGAVFSLFFKGERPCSFCDYILDTILWRGGGKPPAQCRCREGGEPVAGRRRFGDFPLLRIFIFSLLQLLSTSAKIELLSTVEP